MANAPPQPPPPVTPPNEFEIHTDGTIRLTDGKLTTSGVGQINLDDLAKKLKPSIVDPTIPMVESDDVSRPATASPTKGPHRYTVVVPNEPAANEASILNVGVGATDKKVRIIDAGITGRTKTHIHWHTFGAPQTMVALGGPTKEGFAGFKGKNDLETNRGFMMVTDGKSWMDSNEQFYIVARTGQAVVRCEKGNVRLQADDGDIGIGASHDVAVGGKNLVSIVADTTAKLDESGYKQVFDKSYWQLLATKGKKDAMTFLDIIASTISLVQSFADILPVGDDKKKLWKPKKIKSKLKFGIDLAKLASTVTRYVLKDAAGSVKMTGETFASVSGGVAASVYGNLSASLTSPVSASLVGGTSSIKGMLYTSVWAGLDVSLKALKGKAEVSSDFGELLLNSRKAASLSSKAESVTVTSKTNAVVSSETKNAVLHGKAGVYAMAGADPGFGMGATSEMAHLGRIGTTTNFESPGCKPEHGVTVQKEQTIVRHYESKIEVKKGQVYMATKDFTTDTKGGKIKMKAGKILLG
jgi:uncharacterized protein (DUF2345 family)